MNNYLIDFNDKYKTNFILVRYNLEASLENVAYASLLSSYLGYVNNVDNTYQKATQKLDSLYGTKIEFNNSIKANLIVIDISLSFVSNTYLNDENYLDEVIITYLNYIFNPLVENNKFNEEIFTLRKYELIEKIKANYDDKTNYAIDSFVKIFAKDKPLSFNNLGDLDIVKDIDNQKLYHFYQELTKETPFIYAQIEENDYRIIEKLKEKIAEKEIENKFSFYHLKVNEVEEYQEVQNLIQSKLVLGYCFEQNITMEEYYKILVFNAIFGMASNSYLFKIIREKENLCYTIRSSYDYHSNTLIVFAGIEKENYQKTVNLVSDIISKMANGDISEDDFNDAKIVLIDVLNKMKDSQVGYLNYKINRILANFVNDLEIDVDNIMNVSLDDVISIANKMKLKTKYLLSGDNNE